MRIAPHVHVALACILACSCTPHTRPSPVEDTDPARPAETAAAAESDHVYQTIIVGGGIAGLTAAYELKEHDIKVLEKGPGVGGRIWEGEHQGYSYAKGAEYLGEPWGPLEQVIEEYDLELIEVPYPSSCYYNPNVPNHEHIKIFNGEDGAAFMHVMEDGGGQVALDTYNRFTSEAAALYRKVLAAGEYPTEFDMESPLADLDDVTMREWFEKRGFGSTYQSLWNSQARGLYGANMDDVSILMAISEMGWEYSETEPIDMPGESWNEYEYELYETGVFTFENGISEIPAAIAADLGDRIVVNAEVIEVSKRDDAYIVKYREKNKNTVTLRSNSVIMAVPAPVAVKIAPTLITGEKRSLLENVEYSDYITVNLFSEEPIQDFTFDLSLPGDYFVTDFYDSLWVQKKVKPDHPLNDHVHITTAYVAGHSYTDNLLGMTDQEVMERVFAELDEIFPGASSKVGNYEINRFKFGYPVFGLGAYHDIHRLNELNLEKPRTFMLAGDYLAAPTFESTMYLAEYVARRIVIGSPDTRR